MRNVHSHLHIFTFFKHAHTHTHTQQNHLKVGTLEAVLKVAVDSDERVPRQQDAEALQEEHDIGHPAAEGGGVY